MNANISYNTLYFSGNGNHSLGAAIINHLNEYLGKNSTSFRHINFGEYPDGESDALIPGYLEISGKTVVFYQSIFNQKLFEEALELIWAIKKQYKAAYLVAVIPFLTFRRQDHEDKQEEVCRLKMAIDRLCHAGVDEIITVSPHSPQMQKFCNELGVKIRIVDPLPLFASTIRTYLSVVPIIYSPDQGSILRAIELAKLMDSQVIFTLKERGFNNKTKIKPEEEREIENIINFYRSEFNFSEIYYADEEHIKGRAVVMVEDEISTGGTANKTAKYVKTLGADVIIFLAVHAVLVQGWRRMLFDDDPFDNVILADTIPRNYEKRTGGKVFDISVAQIIAQVLYKSLQESVNAK